MELVVIIGLGSIAAICGVVALVRADGGEEWRREWRKRVSSTGGAHRRDDAGKD